MSVSIQLSFSETFLHSVPSNTICVELPSGWMSQVMRVEKLGFVSALKPDFIDKVAEYFSSSK